jgi:hypothetical protein
VNHGGLEYLFTVAAMLALVHTTANDKEDMISEITISEAMKLLKRLNHMDF